MHILVSVQYVHEVCCCTEELELFEQAQIDIYIGKDEVLQQFCMLIKCSTGFTEVGFVSGKGRW